MTGGGGNRVRYHICTYCYLESHPSSTQFQAYLARTTNTYPAPTFTTGKRLPRTPCKNASHLCKTTYLQNGLPFFAKSPLTCSLVSKIISHFCETASPSHRPLLFAEPPPIRSQNSLSLSHKSASHFFTKPLPQFF